MYLYRIDYVDDGSSDSNKIQWSATKITADKACRELKTQGMRGIRVGNIDVPTDKASLMKFLNSYPNTSTP